LSQKCQIWQGPRNRQNKQAEIIKIDKNRNPKWPPAAILDFGLEGITFERLEPDTSNLAHG